jgi:hypothetical protein
MSGLKWGKTHFIFLLRLGPGQKLTRNLHSAFYFKFGIAPHNLKALNGMDDGAKVKIKEFTKRHNQNFTIMSQSGDESVRPKEQHKQSRGSPDRDGNIDNELQHF